MVDDLQKQLVLEQNRKSTGVAYLLWLFLGWFGVHRFYTGNIKSGVAMLILALTGVGLVVGVPWWIVDAFLVPGLVQDKNIKTIQMLSGQPQQPVQQAARQPAPQVASEKPRKPMTEADRRRQEMLEDLRQTGYKKERRDRVF